jgi:hypothetical protein
MGSRSCACVYGISIMYLCVLGLDDVLVCMGSRSCTCVYGVSIMYLCVWGLDQVLVCMGYRSCTYVYGVSIMYLCVWGLDHVLVCMGSRSCTCVYGVSIVPFSTIFIFDFGIVPTLWYFFVFITLIGIIQYKPLNKLQNVAVIYININIHIHLYNFSNQYSLFREWSYIGTRNRAVCTTICQLFRGG